MAGFRRDSHICLSLSCTPSTISSLSETLRKSLPNFTHVQVDEANFVSPWDLVVVSSGSDKTMVKQALASYFRFSIESFVEAEASSPVPVDSSSLLGSLHAVAIVFTCN